MDETSAASPAAGLPDRPHRAWLALFGPPRPHDRPAERLLRFAGFAALTAAPYLVIPRTWVLLAWALQRVTGLDVPLAGLLPETASIPGRLIAFHALALAGWWLPGRWRLGMAAAGALGIGLALRIVDLPSLAALTLFSAAMWGLFHLPIPRWSMLVAVVAGPLALRGLADANGWQALDRTGTSLGLLVLLWYACYQVTTGKASGFPGFLAYLKTRFFMEGPILSPDDVRTIASSELAATRWGGVQALLIALAARTVALQIDRALPGGWDSSSGLELLLYSYANYLSISFALVFSYNLPLGLMRLLGFPVRDNFAWWIFARTPNEHWRRWNMLFREWLITFSFYPMMRARRPLFFSIMATLVISGVLHVYGRVFGGPLSFEAIALIMTYWVVNGVAIWLVVDFPRRFQRLCLTLRLGDHWAWSIVGWILTNVFYAVLFYLHHDCETLADAGAFLVRLSGGA